MENNEQSLVCDEFVINPLVYPDGSPNLFCAKCGYKEEEHATEESKYLDQMGKWANTLCQISVLGKPFMPEGSFTHQFEVNHEIYLVHIEHAPSNIINFPVKSELPKRI